MSYSPTVYCASMVTPSALARRLTSSATEEGLAAAICISERYQARTGFDRSTDEAGRRVRIEVIDERLLADVNLLAFEECRHGNHNGKFPRRPLEVIRHGHHGAIAISDEHDLRRLVEQFRIRLRHVEATEREDRRRRPDGDSNTFYVVYFVQLRIMRIQVNKFCWYPFLSAVKQVFTFDPRYRGVSSQLSSLLESEDAMGRRRRDRGRIRKDYEL